MGSAVTVGGTQARHYYQDERDEGARTYGFDRLGRWSSLRVSCVNSA